jgi:hypothetical protein
MHTRGQPEAFRENFLRQSFHATPITSMKNSTCRPIERPEIAETNHMVLGTSPKERPGRTAAAVHSLFPSLVPPRRRRRALHVEVRPGSRMAAAGPPLTSPFLMVFFFPQLENKLGNQTSFGADNQRFGSV